jgi:hypothetical protein
MLLPYERSLQHGLVGPGLIVPVAGLVAILSLRHQLSIQRRHQPKILAFSAMDRLIFVGLFSLTPNIIKAVTLVKPDNVGPLAPRRFQIVLALEIAPTRNG